jgi:protein-disulfide isomerase
LALSAILLVVGCRAQQPTSAPSNLPEDVQKKVVEQLKSAMSVPPDVDISVGNESASEFNGYSTVPVTFSRNGSKMAVNFLLSKDHNTLVRMEKYDLAKVPLPQEIMKKLDVQGRPVRGNPDAKVTIVNFDDFQCPFCSRMHQELFPAIFSQYRDKVRFIYKDYPLVEIHPWAMHAAVVGNCLAAQNQPGKQFAAYWAFADKVHSSQQEINAGHDVKKSQAEIDKTAHDVAAQNGLDAKQLDACIAKDDKAAVQKSMAEGDALGVQSTPTLFVNGERIEGALPEDMVKKTIDEALKRAGETPPAPTAAVTAPSGASK